MSHNTQLCNCQQLIKDLLHPDTHQPIDILIVTKFLGNKMMKKKRKIVVVLTIQPRGTRGGLYPFHLFVRVFDISYGSCECFFL